MTNEVISPLRRRMIEDMAIRKLSPKTQIGYIRHVKNFAAFVGRSPDTASADDLRRFQLHQRQNGVQASSMNSAVSGLRFFFGVTLDRPDMERHLTFVSEPRKLPVVLSPEEVARLLNAAPGLKYKAALSVAYGAGLRAAEVITRPAPIMLAHRLKQSSQICKKSAQPTSRSHSGDRQRRSALPSTAARTPYHLTGGAQIPIAQAVPLQSFSRGFLPWRFSDASRQHKSHVVSCGRHPKTFTIGDISAPLPVASKVWRRTGSHPRSLAGTPPRPEWS